MSFLQFSLVAKVVSLARSYFQNWVDVVVTRLGNNVPRLISGSSSDETSNHRHAKERSLVVPSSNENNKKESSEELQRTVRTKNLVLKSSSDSESSGEYEDESSEYESGSEEEEESSEEEDDDSDTISLSSFDEDSSIISSFSLLDGANPSAITEDEDTTDEALEQHETNADDPHQTQLSRESKQFFAMLGKYLECRSQMNTKYAQVDEYKMIQNLEIVTDSGGIHVVVDGKNNSQKEELFKAEYRQQAPTSSPASTYEELYSAAEIVKPIYEAEIVRLVDRVCAADGQEDTREKVMIKFAPLKSQERAQEKAKDDYSQRRPGPGLSWLYDIVRGSIAFATAEQIVRFIDILIRDPRIYIVKAKNRFKNPSLTGYRDLNFHIRIDTEAGFQYVCELQIHHAALMNLDSVLQSHRYYEFFRSYFAGGTDTLEARLEDLKAINNSGAMIDETFLGHLLARKDGDIAILKRIADLFHYQLCEYDWALQLYSRIIQVQISSSPRAAPEDIISTYNRMAWALMAKGKDAEAMSHFHKSLAEAKRLVPGKYERGKADVYNGMAIILATNHENLNLAMKACQKAEKIQLRTVGKNDPSIARTYNNMGNILQAKGDLEEAKWMYRESLRIDESLNMMSASTHNNLGSILYKQGKLNEALEHYKKALGIKMRTLGENHLSVAQAYNNVAGILAEMGELDLALDNYLASLKIKRRILGAEHLLIAQAYNNIASVLACNNLGGAIDQPGSDSDVEEEETKHLQKAMNLHKKAFKLIVNKVGKQHLLTAKTYDNVASICRRLREWDKAMKINRKALRIKKTSVGESHLSLAVTYSSMAGILHHQKKYDESIEHYTKSLKIRESIVGSRHRSVLRIYRAMASVLDSKVADIQKQARRWEELGSEEGPPTFNKMSGLLQLHSERASDTLRLQDAPNSRGFELDNLETSLEWDDIEVGFEDMVKLKLFSRPGEIRCIPRDGAPGDAGDLTPIPWIRISSDAPEFTWWRHELTFRQQFGDDSKLLDNKLIEET